MKKWAAFWLLSLIWGSSFLFIRIGVEEVSPFQVVFMRTGIAAIGLNAVLLLRGKHIPFDLRGLIPLIVIGIGNTIIPFALISWGETHVESGLASLLNATAALFTLVIAHFTFHDERITMPKIVGLVVGFIGVMVLASRSWVGGAVITSELAGQLAIVLAALFYAAFGVYSRKTMNDRYEPMVVAAGSMLTAAIGAGILLLLAPAFGGEGFVALNTLRDDTLWALLLLGFFNTFLAYILFYWIIQQLGAGRASMVTYVIPAVGIVLGALVRDEVVDWRLLVGAGLILSGIAIVNLRLFRRRSPIAVPVGEA